MACSYSTKGALEQESAKHANPCTGCVGQHIQCAGVASGIEKLKDLYAEGDYETDCNRDSYSKSSPACMRQAQESEQAQWRVEQDIDHNIFDLGGA